MTHFWSYALLFYGYWLLFVLLIKYYGCLLVAFHAVSNFVLCYAVWCEQLNK